MLPGMVQPRNVDRPAASTAAVAAALAEWYDLRASLAELPAERDRNFLATTAGGEAYVVKVANADTTAAALELQAACLRHAAAAARGVRVPATVATTGGAPMARITIDGASHFLRVVTYVPGRTLGSLRPKPIDTLRRVGAAARTISAALSTLSHPATPDDFVWDLRRAATSVDRLSAAVTDAGRRSLLEASVRRAVERIHPLEAALDVGVIHGDMNDHNLIVGADIGIIDFGDVHRSYVAGEVAIAAAYAAFGFPDPVEAIAAVVAGAHDHDALQEVEIAAVVPLATLRLAMSVVMSAHRAATDAANPYLRVSEDDAWETLGRLMAVPLELAEVRIRAACGLEPSRDGDAVRSWLEAASDRLAPVLELPLDVDSVCSIDWGVSSPEADHPAAAASVEEQSRRVREAMQRAGAAVGIGKYGEPRLVYAAPQYAVPTNRGPAWRTVHLGVDLSCPSGTWVRSLCDGVVDSVHDEAVEGGYGPVVTIRHEPSDGPAFFTLYGHLDGESLRVAPGETVTSGERIATVGTPPDNGNWPPHLHFQVIVDRTGIEGPFPGVALPDDWAAWSSISPSPAAALRLPAATVNAIQPDDAAVVAEHTARLPPSLSTSYSRPLVAVRGFGSSLYDGWGRAHVDCVNNVAHVGHEHPRVVAALGRQAKLLNTNTRYPHPERVRYVQRLADLFPAPLDTVFLVCTGSEANDLALRIARTVTDRRDVAVLAGAYHGHTSELIAASPYKHDGPGGTGAPPYVHVAPLPDPYRSPHGADTAAHLRDLTATLDGAATGLAALMIESMPGVAGQIDLPAGYLRGAFDAVRSRGGLAIADEVQVGLGRVGTHWWAFQRDGTVPDIVTLGKPLGNGHPMAAVVTTRNIAEAFATGMEYFNTFGGNPVSCAVGNAVLDVIRDEQLIDHADRVGTAVRADLTGLAERHEAVGDVRGAGLFLGIELVADRSTKQPAPAAARIVVDRARELGVLLSVDGLLHNVLKFKPPMVFGDADRLRLVEVLDQVLAEDAVLGCLHGKRFEGPR